jgi:hypothetical protein
LGAGGGHRHVACRGWRRENSARVYSSCACRPGDVGTVVTRALHRCRALRGRVHRDRGRGAGRRNGSDGGWHRAGLTVVGSAPTGQQRDQEQRHYQGIRERLLEASSSAVAPQTAHIDIPPEDGVPARQSHYADPRFDHSCVGIRRGLDEYLNVLRFYLTLFLNTLRLGLVVGFWMPLPASVSPKWTSAANAASYLQR